MSRKLHIDIETYSSTDLKKCGVYKYAESADFALLLFAYAFDSDPVQVVDFLHEGIPDEVLEALTDEDTELHAHNATFERVCLRAAGMNTRIEKWHCNAIKSAYCGLPLSLAMVSEAMGLGREGKSATGAALIRFFCVPCKPTNANGGRTRNLPEHAPEKWQAFKEYCKQDVEAERVIHNRLSSVDIPTSDRLMYILDQFINDRGVLVDTAAVRNFISIDQQHAKHLFAEMQRLTGLENPNSVAQLKGWVEQQTGEQVEGITKKTVAELIGKTTGVVHRVMQLRQQAAKTSTKKYIAMLNYAGKDQRARGMLQFYGATRTGRWAGRGVQMQNLPQNHLRNIDHDREMFRIHGYDSISLLYENIPIVLSQLVRTAFVAAPGKQFYVVDFSSIEARVLAWVAGEKWKIDVFNTHGKIYEAAASLMFNVPLQSITKNSTYRTNGKIAELALGYQGGVNALKAFGAIELGMTEDSLPDIVQKWRQKNPQIVKLWYSVENAAVECVKEKKAVVLQAGAILKFSYRNGSLIIQLPSGRELRYYNAVLYEGKFGKSAIKYKGMQDGKQVWGWVDSYGGKFVENIIQAIARDVLVQAMLRLHIHRYPIVLHVHDEVVVEGAHELDLTKMIEIMTASIGWATGLPTNAAGFITRFYKKD